MTNNKKILCVVFHVLICVILLSFVLFQSKVGCTLVTVLLFFFFYLAGVHSNGMGGILTGAVLSKIRGGN